MNDNKLIITNYINDNLNYYKRLHIVYNKLPLLLKENYKDYQYNKKSLRKIRENLFFYRILKKYPYFSINFLKFIWTNHLKFINNYTMLYNTISDYLNKYNINFNVFYVNKINAEIFKINLKKKEKINKIIIFETDDEKDFKIIDKKNHYLLFINKDILSLLLDKEVFYDNLFIYINENLNDTNKLDYKFKMLFFNLFFTNREDEIIKLTDEFNIKFTKEYMYTNININDLVEFSTVIDRKIAEKLNFDISKFNNLYIAQNSELKFSLKNLNNYSYLMLLNKENFLKIYNIFF